MKEKNKKLIILVGVLLLFGGTTLAYFVSQVLSSGKGASTEGTTAVIKGSTLNVVGTLEFNDTNIYPGHKNVSGVKVTATGDNELIPYNLIWEGTNTLTSLNYTIYKTSTSIDVTSSCEKKTTIENGAQILKEKCSISNIESLGSAIGSGVINKNDTKVVLAKDEFINSTITGLSMHYYVILEYPNLDESQNEDLGGSFTGKVKVEGSNTKPDINIMAVYIEQEDGSYKESEDIPQENYVINQEKSTCSNGAVPGWDIIKARFYAENLIKKETKCYLYFDYDPSKVVLDKMGIIANYNKPDFTKVATSDEGVYALEDELYEGVSYYWRGAVTNNYVKFGGYCWRIVRINGDGSIRMIYDGTMCHANGINTTDSNAVMEQKYNVGYQSGAYVGWTWTSETQRPSATASNMWSTAKSQVEAWYKKTLKSYESYLEDGKYCNDRNIASGYSWDSQSYSNFYFAGYDRLSKNYATKVFPTLACHSEDIYTLKVGFITADEMSFAGGVFGRSNYNYYLFNGQIYWTMTPYSYPGSATMFTMHFDGSLTWNGVESALSLRPVINLKNDIKFSSGDGTIDNPYIVEGAT